MGVACHVVAAAVTAGLYLTLFSVQGLGCAGNHRGRLSQCCTRNGQHTRETLSPHLGQQCLNEEICSKKDAFFFLNSVQLVRDLNLLALVVVSSNKTVYIC